MSAAENFISIIKTSGPFHRPRPLPGLQYFSCLHVRPCLTNNLNGENGGRSNTNIEYFKIYEKKHVL